MQFIYPYEVYDDGGSWQVRFPDVPEALTEGETEAEAHSLAPDALLAALGAIAKLRRPIPTPSSPGEHHVVVPMLQSAKLALYQAMREHDLTNVAFAEMLGKHENDVRRMLDLDHQTKIGSLENALTQLGKQVAIEVRAAA
jgi:antitoxin HicB